MASIDAVAIFGSPIYDNPQEPSVSMADGFVPSDGHITVARGRSAHSLAGLENALGGTPVHFSYDGYDWTINARHHFAVHRYVALGMDTLGGALVTFNTDRGQLIDQIHRGVDTPVETFERAASDKLEMIQIRPDRTRRLPIHEREVTTAPISAQTRRRATDLEVGISWNCACDMDIYVQAHPQARVLYFGQTNTREGQFWRDYRSGRDLLNGLESVTFHAPVNLDEMVIGVNFYSGRAPQGVTGELRLAIGGATYAQPFTINATSGNGGRGAAEMISTRDAPNDHWVVFEATDVVNAR
ncbi:MAG: hypothetical protein ACFB2Z_11130 [Maricaulaceae bacterium]